MSNLEPIPTSADRYVYAVELVRVIDGDTLVVDIDLGCEMWLRGQHVRLWGIDSPEPHTETKAAGDAATRWLRGLLEGAQEILVRTHFDKTGSFRRLLVDVFADGANINQIMVTSGHAKIMG